MDVSRTASEALMCKMSALESERSSLSSAFSSKTGKQTPLLDVFYGVRHKSLHCVVEQYFQTLRQLFGASKTLQMLILGCGYDESYYRYVTMYDISIFEVDIPLVIQNKKSKIDLKSRNIHSIGCDITNIKELIPHLSVNGFNFSSPTLVLAECVFSYNIPSSISDVLNSLKCLIVNIFVVYFDPILDKASEGFDSFMLSRFSSRGAPLQHYFPSKRDHYVFLRETGYIHSIIFNMREIWELISSKYEKLIEFSDLFDEYASLSLLFSHYIVAVATPNLLLFDLVVNKRFLLGHITKINDEELIRCRLSLTEERLQYLAMTRSELCEKISFISPNIRLASASDFPRISQLYAESFEALRKIYPSVNKFVKKTIKLLLQQSKNHPTRELDGHYFLYEQDCQILGFIGVKKDLMSHQSFISNFAVNELHRGKGIGKLLLSQALNFAQDSKSIDLSVVSDLEAAICLYKSEKFQEIERNQLPDGCTILHFRWQPILS